MNHRSIAIPRTIPALLGALLFLAAACDDRSGEPPSPERDPGGELGDGELDDSGMDSQDASIATAPTGPFAQHVVVHLQRLAPGGTTIAFGLPIPPGIVVADVGKLKIATTAGVAIAGARVRELLAVHNASGTRVGARAVQVQLPASAMPGATLDVDVSWTGGTTAAAATVTYADATVSRSSASTAPVAERTIKLVNGVATLVETSKTTKTLYTGREPYVLATFPDGYLAATRLMGAQIPLSQQNVPERAGLRFVGESLRNFTRSAMYKDGYALNPAADSVVDPIPNYEGWLYDRCSTWLVAYTVVGDPELLREAHRACTYYASKIDATGYFTGKPTKDEKYSHLRGLYAYYALTGDEAALTAGRRIADLWYNDTLFVGPYAAGHTRGPDKLWTERLLATSMEGLYYGARLTGDAKYLTRFKAMFDTAYRHITGTAADLAAINPGIPVKFPPQNCFIHTGLQQSDAEAGDPWCSMWMSELAVDVLLRWQEQSNDGRVDEVFVRLTRAMRDFATSYAKKMDLVGDTFLKPTLCYSEQGEQSRMLAPLYGAGLMPDGKRIQYGDGTDVEHCADASAISAAGIRALARQGKLGAPGPAPFATEGASFLALHQELAMCAQRLFTYSSRPARNPANWTANQLKAGLASPTTFIASNKIGYPQYPVAPQRKLSWWFNMSTMQMALLEDAGIKLTALKPGQVQPAGCP